MAFTNRLDSFIPRWRQGTLAMLVLIVLVGCGPPSATTYSGAEQYALSRARSTEMVEQLEFSFRLDPESVSVGQNIDFIATLTNTTDQPIILRKPLQQGVIEALYADTTLLFSVESLSEGPSFEYPHEGLIFRFTKRPIPDEFMTLAPHASYETRLQLPHIVNSLEVADVQFPLPAGQYRVHMTYMNHAIGHEVNVGDDSRFADLNAWVGEVVAEPVALTVLPTE